jgi:hypothetical protein
MVVAVARVACASSGDESKRPLCNYAVVTADLDDITMQIGSISGWPTGIFHAAWRAERRSGI